MAKLSGAAADARLAEAWDAVFRQDPAAQQIVHVLTWATEYPAWLGGFSPFEAWRQNGCTAGDKVWQAFAAVAASWPYIRNARRAGALGIPNVRILVLERARGQPAPPWVRYLAEVHLPAIAALAGEKLYHVWRDDCRDSGLPERDYDVSLWGAAGVMLAGYKNGDVDWRVFLADDHDPGRSLEERGFVIAMRDFAAARGHVVALPAELQPRLPGDLLPGRAAVAGKQQLAGHAVGVPVGVGGPEHRDAVGRGGEPQVVESRAAAEDLVSGGPLDAAVVGVVQPGGAAGRADQES